MRLNQVTLGAKNMAASVVFYKNLGLTVIVDSAPRYVRFEFPRGDGGEPDTLSLHAVEAGWKARDDGPLIYFEVEDVAAFLEDVGVKPIAAPELKSYLWTEADILDPSGNRIRIFSAGDNRRFPPWRV
ncbi:MAG: VOC family protein [Hellea sp.]|nr:VOC family protein [Hellea sp.]